MKGPSKSDGKPSEYYPLPVRSLLREQVRVGGRFLSLDPYRGCEMACTFCSTRLGAKDFDRWRELENRIGVKANAPEVLREEMKARDLSGELLVLGHQGEPWQPAEERFRITRSLLALLAEVEDIDLWINTRSSLIARDTDLLAGIAENGHLRVAFSLATLDEHVNHLLEPKAPSALRRLSAMEALARAGVPVGVWVSPLLPGLDADELGLEALLTRAAHAGARFAGLRFLALPPPERENFFAHVTTAYPESAVKFRRMVGLKQISADDRQEVVQAFEAHCRKLGLFSMVSEPTARVAAVKPPTQLPLFRS